MTGNGLFEKTKEAKVKNDKVSATEELNLKIYEYIVHAYENEENPTLQGLALNLESQMGEQGNIEYVLLASKNTASIKDEKDFDVATKIYTKLKTYSYEFEIGEGLNISKIDGIEVGEMNSEEKRKAEMQKKLDNIKNTPELYDNLEGLIPTLTENSVTKVNNSDTITYTDIYGGTIRSSVDIIDGYFPWKAFDGNENTKCISVNNKALNHYVEYEFPNRVYILKAYVVMDNAATAGGQREYVIQGYDESSNEWENLSDVNNVFVSMNLPNKQIIELDYSKSYKRYRVYVTSLGNSSGIAAENSSFQIFQLYGIEDK